MDWKNFQLHCKCSSDIRTALASEALAFYQQFLVIILVKNNEQVMSSYIISLSP